MVKEHNNFIPSTGTVLSDPRLPIHNLDVTLADVSIDFAELATSAATIGRYYKLTFQKKADTNNYDKPLDTDDQSRLLIFVNAFKDNPDITEIDWEPSTLSDDNANALIQLIKHTPNLRSIRYNCPPFLPSIKRVELAIKNNRSTKDLLSKDDIQVQIESCIRELSMFVSKFPYNDGEIDYIRDVKIEQANLVFSEYTEIFVCIQHVIIEFLLEKGAEVDHDASLELKDIISLKLIKLQETRFENNKEVFLVGLKEVLQKLITREVLDDTGCFRIRLNKALFENRKQALDKTGNVKLINQQPDEEQNPLQKSNALGDDRNIADDGGDRKYWYSIGDGFRLLIAIRKGLNYFRDEEETEQFLIKTAGEEYSATRENKEHILITDPYHIDNFADSLSDDIKTITGTHAVDKHGVDQRAKNHRWAEMPEMLIMPLLSGMHWQVIRVKINYETSAVSILYSDPYGNGFSNALIATIEASLLPAINALISAYRDAEYVVPEGSISRHIKEIDQQGRGVNGFDCGPITFSNIADYIDVDASNIEFADGTRPHTISAASDVGHKNEMIALRAGDVERYRDVAGIAYPGSSAERIENIKKLLKKSAEAKRSQLQSAAYKDTVYKEIASKISSLSDGICSFIFEMIDSERAQKELDSNEGYTIEELVKAYNLVTGEWLVTQSAISDLSATGVVIEDIVQDELRPINKDDGHIETKQIDADNKIQEIIISQGQENKITSEFMDADHLASETDDIIVSNDHPEVGKNKTTRVNGFYSGEDVMILIDVLLDKDGKTREKREDQQNRVKKINGYYTNSMILPPFQVNADSAAIRALIEYINQAIDNEVTQILVPINIHNFHWVTLQLNISVDGSHKIEAIIHDSNAKRHSLEIIDKLKSEFIGIYTIEQKESGLARLQEGKGNVYCGGYTARLIAFLATNYDSEGWGNGEEKENDSWLRDRDVNIINESSYEGAGGFGRPVNDNIRLKLPAQASLELKSAWQEIVSELGSEEKMILQEISNDIYQVESAKAMKIRDFLKARTNIYQKYSTFFSQFFKNNFEFQDNAVDLLWSLTTDVRKNINPLNIDSHNRNKDLDNSKAILIARAGNAINNYKVDPSDVDFAKKQNGQLEFIKFTEDEAKKTLKQIELQIAQHEKIL
ncbi:MAG: hypothetical protein WCP46_05120, partial [Alphaproteobacteria bacterium]